MAEFVEVMKQKKRMCDSIVRCGNCPMSCDNNGNGKSCAALEKEHPREAEEIIMNWAKENPVKTNADKFKEIFGFEPNDDTCPYKADKCEIKCGASSCSKYDFWNQEYKEPKGE